MHRTYATPVFLCLAAIVFADIAFAIDSIPAAFAITRDPLLIWMGNVFALLGLRALFVLVESLIARFRYLDETIAIVLGLVGVKLLIEDLVYVGPVESLAVIAVAFAIGIALSVRADRHDPQAEEHREERVEAMHESHHLADGSEACGLRSAPARRTAPLGLDSALHTSSPAARQLFAPARPAGRPTGRRPRPSRRAPPTSARGWGGRGPRGPSAASRTSPAAASVPRCFCTACRLTGSSRARSVAVASPRSPRVA